MLKRNPNFVFIWEEGHPKLSIMLMLLLLLFSFLICPVVSLSENGLQETTTESNNPEESNNTLIETVDPVVRYFISRMSFSFDLTKYISKHLSFCWYSCISVFRIVQLSLSKKTIFHCVLEADVQVRKPVPVVRFCLLIYINLSVV